MRRPTMVTILMLCVPLTAFAQQTARIKVARADQLPRHYYPVNTTVTEIFQDDRQFAAFAQQVAADLRADLGKYDIRDHATLASYYTTLGNLALERADYQTALAYQDSVRAVEDKLGPRLSAGILERARAAAGAPDQPLDTARFRQAFRREIAALPYPEGVVALTAMQHRFALQRPGFQVQRLAPGAGNGSLALAQAQRLIAMRVVRDWILPVRDVILAEIDGMMALHKANANIWPARDVSLDGRSDLTPVTMAIWDSGIDVDVYPTQLFTNPGEIAANGKDDDGNGYIDDVHGIAYDLERGRITDLLQDSRKPQLLAFSGDPYTHGTLVAGLAARGNPAARMLVARRSNGMGGSQQREASTPPPTMKSARAFAQEIRESIEYFRQHGVRVVNMSWGFNPGGYETNLAAHNIGTPEEQRRLGRQIFDVAARALREAMAGVPNMLFVVSAGNDDADVTFTEGVPPSFDLPNLITVGAVDDAGGEVWFTNYGKVDVFANGFQVLSKLPGGSESPVTGTSAAAPQVTNLAAKLLAVKPTLTVAELRRAILESADEKYVGQNRRIRLLNPKAALLSITVAALNAQRSAQAPPTLILVGGKVFTADSTRPWAEAVALRDERIVAVGTNRDIEKLAGPATQRVDVGGRVIVPGFNDAHTHIGCWNTFAVPFIRSDDPMSDPSFAVVTDSLRAAVPRTPSGTWLVAQVGRTVIEDRAARRAALDEIAPRHPVGLFMFGGHGVVYNSAALRVLGISDTARDPVGGSYEREPGSARITGSLREYAILSAMRRLCSRDADSTMVRALKSDSRDWLRLGITSLQSFSYPLEAARLMRTLQAAEVPQRVRIIPMPSTSPAGRNLGEWKTELALQPVARNAAGGSNTVSGVKWILDGTPIERGAAHRTAYLNRPDHFGTLNFPPDTIRAILLEARAARQQALLHAGGDSTLAVILDVMEKTGGARVWRSERVRIEHGDALLPDLQGRARDLGVIVVQNPTHFALPGLLSTTYDSATTAAFQPMRTLVAAGIPIAIGTDAAGAAMSPFLNIMFATTHPNNPGEALTREQAVTAYTRGSAYAEMAEAGKGTLVPGMLADLAVLSQDIFTVPAPQLPATTSVLTLIGGRIVHDELTNAGAAVKRP